jgi:hypothetical protein
VTKAKAQRAPAVSPVATKKKAAAPSAAPTRAERRFREAEQSYRETYGGMPTDATKSEQRQATAVADALALSSPPTSDVFLKRRDDEAPGVTLTKAMLGQNIRHGAIAVAYAGKSFNMAGEPMTVMDAAVVVEQRATEAANGDLSAASAMLASQALTLDVMFTEFANRAAGQIGINSDAVERYARLAMKAQSNARTTLEALAKLRQPRVQEIRHVHVNAGGQAVVAEEFHHHQTGGQGIETGERAHEPRAKAAGIGTALLSQDAFRDTVSVPKGKR